MFRRLFRGDLDNGKCIEQTERGVELVPCPDNSEDEDAETD